VGVNSRFNFIEEDLGGTSDKVVDISPDIDVGMICYCGWSGACPTQIFDVVD
jgi:hypothetical protein